jgi:hypothetical protein
VRRADHAMLHVVPRVRATATWLTAIVATMLVASSSSAAVEPPLQPAQRVAPPPRSLTVAAVGDWLSERQVNDAAAAAARSGVRFDHRPLLAPIAPLIGAVDLAICHMETPIGVPGQGVGRLATASNGRGLLAAPYELAADLRAVGFDRCSTASNHSWDLGVAGITSTLDAFDQVGISHNGTARSLDESQPAVFAVNNIRVAHLSYTRGGNIGFPSQEWLINRAETSTAINADVRAARAAGAEVVIVSIHVMPELGSAPAAADRAIVEEVTAGGAVDLVLMHGPHTIQPVERVNGVLVYWSLGNFISGMGTPSISGRFDDPRTLDGLMANVTFTEQPNGRFATEPWTVLLCNQPFARLVWPGVQALNDTQTPTSVLATLRACVERSSAVVDGLN